MLPRIKIDFLSGQLGRVGTSPDGLVALVVSAKPVKSTFTLEKGYTVRQLSDLKALGVTEENNAELYRHVSDFYRETPEGTALVVCGAPANKKMAELLEKEQGVVRQLIEAHKGELRAILLSSTAGDTEAVTEGLSPDVFASLAPAQELSELATTNLYAPLFVVLDGRGYTGESLRDLSGASYNRVGILVGSRSAEDKGSCLGILAGRLATKPVQRNIGRVRDGALRLEEAYLGGRPIEERQSQVMDLHEKRYITLRRYVGRAGLFFTDDNLASSPKDDYAQMASRRVIDKAYRIAYDTLLDMMLDELELNEDGTMQAPIIKAWEQKVVGSIDRAMTASGELSGDDGSGCKCFIDPKQNVVGASRIEISLKVRPHGYARYIDVSLGFLVSSAKE